MKLKVMLATAVLALASAPALAEQPAVGDLFDAPSTAGPDAFKWKFRGWRYVGHGAAIGLGRFVLFTDEHSTMIAATEVVAPSTEYARDGVQRITAIRIVAPEPGEKQATSCDFVTLSPVLAFYNGNIVRGFFVVGTEILQRRWFKDDEVCYDSPD